MLRDARLDWLKAIAISLVLIWHLHPLYVEGAPLLERAVSFFDWNVSLVAVPTFLLVSLHLYFKKGGERGAAFARRIWRLSTIFFFWVSVQILVAAGIERRLPRPSWMWLLLGGPDLPLVGGSVFYYLFDLIVLTAISFLFLQLPAKAKFVMGWIIGGVTLAQFEYSFLTGREIPYWRLDSFLIYVPLAFYLPSLTRYRWLFLCVYVLFSVHDLRGHASSVVYGRISIVAGALALFGFMAVSGVRGGRVTRALALQALGIFAVHKYWQYFCLALKGNRSLNIVFDGMRIHGAAFLIFIAVLALTLVTVALLSRTPLRRFVL